MSLRQRLIVGVLVLAGVALVGADVATYASLRSFLLKRTDSSLEIDHRAVESVLGSADIPEVTMTSATAPGVTHRWINIWAYADEVSLARIYAGFHYRFSTRVGQNMGRDIGRHVVQGFMQKTAVADTR